MKRILCATDLSPRCEGAVHRAGMLAQQYEAQLALLHVLDPVLFLEQEQEHVIARLRSQAAPPLWPFEATPTIEVRTGPVANVIRNVAEEAGAELIIMGAQRRRAVGDAVVGTTVERVLRSSGPAVLLVNGDPLNTYRNVLLALDASPASARAIQIAESLFLGDGARASVVHAYATIRRDARACWRQRLGDRAILGALETRSARAYRCAARERQRGCQSLRHRARQRTAVCHNHESRGAQQS